jgi:hypothetical protein
MAVSKMLARTFVALTILAPISASAAQAAPLVTYSWTTTSEGFGPTLGEPSLATFQVPLSDVHAGVIPQFDVTNIQMAYPGLSFTGTTTSSIGFDFAAYVDPVSGAFTFHDANQGFAVFAYSPDLFTYDTFLSILVGNPNAGLNGVADQFNALNHNAPAAGFPTAGHWTASFPVSTPLPAALPLFGSGFAGLGFVAWRRKRTSARSVSGSGGEMRGAPAGVEPLRRLVQDGGCFRAAQRLLLKPRSALEGDVNCGMGDDQHRAGTLQRRVHGARTTGEELADRFGAVRRHAVAPSLEPAAGDFTIKAAEAAVAQTLDGDDRRMDMRGDDLRRGEGAVLRAGADGLDARAAQHLAGAARLGEAAAVQGRVDAAGETAVAIPIGLTVIEEEEAGGVEVGCYSHDTNTQLFHCALPPVTPTVPRCAGRNFPWTGDRSNPNGSGRMEVSRHAANYHACEISRGIRRE